MSNNPNMWEEVSRTQVREIFPWEDSQNIKFLTQESLKDNFKISKVDEEEEPDRRKS